MRRGTEKGREKTRKNHVGYPQNPLRKRQQLLSLPLVPLSNKKGRDRDKLHYTLGKEKVQE